MDHTTDMDRLVRYVVGACSPDESAEIERWIAADPARLALVNELRTIWTTADVAPAGWDAWAAWDKVSSKIDVSEQRTGVRQWAWRAAAVLALVAGGSLLYRSGAISPGTSAGGAAERVATRTYTTQPGQRTTLRLPDGTRVILGAASSLHVTADYGARRRDVRLEGQAYFEVEHDETRSFQVHTARGIAEDLGTRFDVVAYASDTATQVTVADGKVALKTGTHAGPVLESGQLGRIGASGAMTVEYGVDVARRLAWTEGRLIFTDTPLRDALPQLSRWYDIEFRLADTVLAALPLTATFLDRSSPEVVDLLALTLGVRQVRRGRVVTLYPR